MMEDLYLSYASLGFPRLEFLIAHGQPINYYLNCPDSGPVEKLEAKTYKKTGILQKESLWRKISFTKLIPKSGFLKSARMIFFYFILFIYLFIFFFEIYNYVFGFYKD